jgi:superfamily II RNA helicase
VTRLVLPEHPNADDALEAFLGWVADQGLALYPAQEEAILALFAGSHVILTTPTGSGKSLVATAGHVAALAAGERSVYTAPIKALVSEKFFQLREALGDEMVGMLTGDATINPDAPVICATAEILAHQALGGTPGGAPTHVTMDEFHYYDEPDRGWAWQVPLLELADTRFLAMSATLGDISWLADDLLRRTGRDVEVVTGIERPVPLSFEYRTTSLTETVEELIAAERVPAYVVHFTQQAATEQAQAFTSLNVLTKADRQELSGVLAGVRFDTPFGKDLKRFLSHGVGVHHAGLLPRYRLLVERLAKEGWLRLICGTDTLGVGVNIPIRTVLFTQLYKYDGVETRILTVREFAQVAGRAGRRGYDTEGYVLAQAPPHVVENLRAEQKAGTNTAKLRRIVKKKPPERGYAHWNRDTFERLTAGTPERLNSRLTEATAGYSLSTGTFSRISPSTGPCRPSSSRWSTATSPTTLSTRCRCSRWLRLRWTIPARC